jgi:tetratricopeptide (TPR) repeat protein
LSARSNFDTTSRKSKKNGQPKQKEANPKHHDNRVEGQFEEQALEIVHVERWNDLEVAAVDHLEAMNGKSPKGFFYLGIALYKMRYYAQALKAFQKSSELKADDAQLQYNLGLAYFQVARYDAAVEHLKLCTDFDPGHLHAYNNLAFIYNMHQLYPEAIHTCTMAR